MSTSELVRRHAFTDCSFGFSGIRAAASQSVDCQVLQELFASLTVVVGLHAGSCRQEVSTCHPPQSEWDAWD